MATPAYSTNFFTGGGPADSYTNMFTVPSGYVYVVRDITAFCGVGVSEGVFGFLIALATGATVWQVWTPYALSGISYHWQGRKVLEASEELRVFLGDNSWEFRVDGYALTVA